MDHSNYHGHDHQNQSSNPTITLRKGKTEIKIENAAAVIKKINEMYPARVEYDGWYYAPSWNKKQKRTEAEIERQRQWIESAKDWFKSEMFNGTGSFEVVVEEPHVEPKKPSDFQPFTPKFNAETQTVQTPYGEYTLPFLEDLASEAKRQFNIPEPQMVQSVNKNAYELREMILENAISVVRETNKNISTDAFVDKVLEVSDKFYSFVENRRKNR